MIHPEYARDASDRSGAGEPAPVGGQSEVPPAGSVYPGFRVLLTFPIYNEASKLDRWIDRLDSPVADKIVAIDDGSTDEGPEVLRNHGVEVLSQPRSGIGACIKRSVSYARENGYDVLVVMAGNGKDDPQEIPRLVHPIVQDGADYVQGSRFLPGGSSPNLPIFRHVSIKLLSLLFSILMGRRCTDLTNGFRAYRLSLLDDPDVDIWQDWLDTYEYEYYVHWKAYALGYSVAEVPVTKRYPETRGEEYTKIRPVAGWWSMLRPLVLLGLRIRK